MQLPMKQAVVRAIALSFFLGAPALAGVHDEFASRAIQKRLSAEAQDAESAGQLEGDARRRLDVAYHDAKARLAALEALVAKGQPFDASFHAFLRDNYLPRLERIYTAAKIAPDAAAYVATLAADKRAVEEVEVQLKAAKARVLGRHPLLERTLQLAAFSRSETLGDGVIGDWSPAAADEIQSSAVHGLYETLDAIATDRFRKEPVSIDALSTLHAKMLGKAAHFYSQPGRINDIKWTAKDGSVIPVRAALAELQDQLNAAPPSLETARLAYERFLYYHPYGDSNGRIAEVLMEIVLAKGGLPPLVTREKTALENYFFQVSFGEGGHDAELAALGHETLSYLEAWERLLGSDHIESVELAGGNVVVTTRHGEGRRVIVTNRTYVVPADAEMPPVKGSVVLAAGVQAGEAKMKVTSDGWKSSQELSPTQVLNDIRLGEVKLANPFYTIDLPAGHQGGDVEFLFHYKHPNGQEIFFKNEQRNYKTFVPPSPASPCGSLATLLHAAQ